MCPKGAAASSPGLTALAVYPGLAVGQDLSTPTGLRQKRQGATPSGLIMNVYVLRPRVDRLRRATLGYGTQRRWR